MRVEDLSSALYHGRLRHQRCAPVAHRFQYRLYQVLLNLDELPQLARRLRPFGYNRPAVTSFHDRDHLHAGEEDTRLKLRRLLLRAGVPPPGGPTLLLTHLRVLGYVFNPVSFFYCLDPDHHLRVVVAEVNNTFGERHCYVLSQLQPTAGGVLAEADKVFHVSPFFPIAGRYRFYFTAPGPSLAVRIALRRGEAVEFWADLEVRRSPLTSATLSRALCQVPWVTLKTIAGIHWEALRLWCKGAPFHRKPAPPPSLLEDGR